MALCPYGALEIIDTDAGKKARTIEVACKGCGTCVATCPSGVARQKGFDDLQIYAEVEGILA